MGCCCCTRCKRALASSRKSCTRSRGALGAAPKSLMGFERAINRSPRTNCASLKLGCVLSKESTSFSATSRRLLPTACKLLASACSILRDACSSAARLEESASSDRTRNECSFIGLYLPERSSAICQCPSFLIQTKVLFEELFRWLAR